MKKTLLSLVVLFTLCYTAKAQLASYEHKLIDNDTLMSEVSVIEGVLHWHMKITQPNTTFMQDETLAQMIGSDEDGLLAGSWEENFIDEANGNAVTYQSGVHHYYGSIDLNNSNYMQMQFRTAFYADATPGMEKYFTVERDYFDPYIFYVIY